MHPLKRWFGLRQIATPLFLVLLAGVSAAAQMAPTRTWEELKQETQRRVDKNLGPVGGLKSEDAREALSNIHSLDRDEWAAAWSAIGERYEKRAKSEEAAKNNDAARDDYFSAFRYYTAARWPVPNSIGQAKSLSECASRISQLRTFPRSARRNRAHPVRGQGNSGIYPAAKGCAAGAARLHDQWNGFAQGGRSSRA